MESRRAGLDVIGNRPARRGPESYVCEARYWLLGVKPSTPCPLWRTAACTQAVEFFQLDFDDFPYITTNTKTSMTTSNKNSPAAPSTALAAKPLPVTAPTSSAKANNPTSPVRIRRPATRPRRKLPRDRRVLVPPIALSCVARSCSNGTAICSCYPRRAGPFLATVRHLHSWLKSWGLYSKPAQIVRRRALPILDKGTSIIL